MATLRDGGARRLTLALTLIPTLTLALTLNPHPHPRHHPEQVERVAFLYHYIPPLLLTFLGAGIAFDLVTARLTRYRPFRPFVHYGRGGGGGGGGGGGAAAVALDAISLREVLCALLLLLFAASWGYFAPLYFGFPMQPDEQAPHTLALALALALAPNPNRNPRRAGAAREAAGYLVRWPRRWLVVPLHALLLSACDLVQVSSVRRAVLYLLQPPPQVANYE